MKSVIVAGHLCVDLIPSLDALPVTEPGRLVAVGPLSMAVGGCVGNTGLALAAMGIPTRLAACVGTDRLGDALVAMLADAGLDVAAIARIADRGTSYSVVMDVPGRDRTIWHHVGANEAFTGEGVIPLVEAAARGSILHLGYPTHLPGLFLDGGDRLIGLAAAARQSGALVSIDMAEIDPLSPAHEVDWRRLFERLLPAVDVLKGSVDDFAAALGEGRDRSAAEWAQTLVEMGASAAVVTAGAEGMCLQTASRTRLGRAWADRALSSPSLADRVVATTGAGDTAAAGFLVGLASGLDPIDCLATASRAAAARIGGRPLTEVIPGGDFVTRRYSNAD